jgi:hypothetical protein
VCCQVEVSATGWSLVQRSPTECGVSKVCDREASKKWGGLGPQGAVEPLRKMLNYPVEHCLFEGPQASPAYPSDKRSTRMKMSMEHRWNNTDGGEPEVLGQKPVPVILRPLQTSHGLSRVLSQASAVNRTATDRLNHDTARRLMSLVLCSYCLENRKPDIQGNNYTELKTDQKTLRPLNRQHNPVHTHTQTHTPRRHTTTMQVLYTNKLNLPTSRKNLMTYVSRNMLF